MAYNRTISAASGPVSAPVSVMASRRLLLAKAASALALATGLALGASGTAHAQASVGGGAFEGTPTVASGSVFINRGTNTDNIRVDSNQAVINWTTNDIAIGGGVINFLPNGRTAFFRNNPTAQNQFTVLNRIIPTDPSRAIALNGTIISQLQTGAGLVSGGNVWFYSPGGIVVGSTGVIDVGGLLLTSLDPVRDATGNFITPGRSFALGGAATRPASYIQIDPGAQIRATPQNSYVATVAPIIRQNGNINVNGSALMVGAEAATITFGTSGLFDIQVTTGTNGDAAAGNGAVAHSGTTGGPTATTGNSHRIYMVAVPKNNAITMAIGGGGSLGFDIAGAANVVGNSIILSAGYNVFGDNIDTSGPVIPGQQARLFITNGNVTSALQAAAVTEAVADADGANLDFASNLGLYSAGSARLTARNGGVATIVGNVGVSANVRGRFPGDNGVGGTAQVYALLNGTINIGGSATITADGLGADNFDSGSVGSGTGGTALLQTASGGTVVITGDALMSANGVAGNGAPGLGIGSNFGRGGTVVVSNTESNARMFINGRLDADANGTGSNDFGTGTAGAGFGGTISVAAGNPAGTPGAGNALTIQGETTLNADGFGGSSDFGNGGAGTGGSNSLGAGIGGIVGALGNLTITASGTGGGTNFATGIGGVATGGRALVQVFAAGGTLNAGGNVLLQATGNGGAGNGQGGNGGNGSGGQAQFVLNGAGGSINATGTTMIDALGIGGQGIIGGSGTGGLATLNTTTSGVITLSNALTISAGGTGGSAATPGRGRSGNGNGGTAQIVALANGAINITGNVDVSANGTVLATALAGIDGGDGTGGNASISQNSGGLITITGNAFVSAQGQGDANQGGGDGIGGNGTGGDARIAVNDRRITITGNATAAAGGRGGENRGGLRGGTGTGGLANLGAGNGTLAIGGEGIATADGTGGDSGSNGSGGDGLGGRAIIGAISGGIIQIAGAGTASGQGFGGRGFGAGGTGGQGTGRLAQIFGDNGRVTITGLTVANASGFGGTGTDRANGGAALGGNASLLAQGNGQITLGNNALFSAQALSGNVLDGAGNVGAATGGTVDLLASNAGSVITVNGTLTADATAGSGSTAAGLIGDAVAGNTTLRAISGAFNVTGDVSLNSAAFGGVSQGTGNGGNATGGRAAVLLQGAGNGSITLGSRLTMVVDAVGGDANTGNGGNATGGVAELGSTNVPGTLTITGATLMRANAAAGNALIVGNGGNATGGILNAGTSSATLRGTDLTLSAIGTAGNGAGGGNGGNGTGGNASLVADSGLATGLVDFDNVLITVGGIGGAGGGGRDGATGGNGGAGGAGTGGSAGVLAAAGNGQLDLANVQINADGRGGAGGTGGVGASGAGGNGGAGGAGIGGTIDVGMFSGTAALNANLGFTDVNTVQITALGLGGAGGSGGTGSTVRGNGGAGGAGTGGDSALIVRGSRVTADDITMLLNGTGGAGGSGATGGAGGNGTAGNLTFSITDRFQIPANRGLLQARNITAISDGIGGTGATGAANGQSLYSTGSGLELRNADAAVTSFIVNRGANLPSPGTAVEDFIRITDGAMTTTGSFTYITPNSLSVLVNNGSLTAGAVGLVARTFVADTAVASPNTIGTITADAASLQSVGDIRATANIVVRQNFNVSAPGTVTLRDVTSTGGVIAITGGAMALGNLNAANHVNLVSTTGAITAGNVTAANFIAMTAANGLTLNQVRAGTGRVDLLLQAGNLLLGDVTAGAFIALESRGGSITTGSLGSGSQTRIAATGNVSFGNVDAGLDLGVSANGTMTGGNIVTRGVRNGIFFGVGLTSGLGTQVGTIQSAGSIGVVTPATFTSGSLTSGNHTLLLVNGNIQINGGVTTAAGNDRFFYIGNASMAALLGGDPAVIFAATPVRTLGSLNVTGAIQSGNVLAGIGTGLLVSGAITADGGRIGLTANSITAQRLTSTLASAVTATNGNILLGNVTAGGALTLQADTGLITAGPLSGTLVNVDGQGAVSIGGITTTGAAQLRSRSASFTSTGAIIAGAVNIGGASIALTNVTSTAGAIAMAATAGNLSFGTLSSSANTQFSATGSVTGGDISSASWIGTTVGGTMTLGNLRSTGAGVSPNGFSIGLGANGTIVTGTINSFGRLGIGSDDGQGNLGDATTITTGAITAGASVLLRSRLGLTTGAVTSTNEIRMRGGAVTTGALNATNAILAAAMTGNLTTGNVTTGTSAVLLSGGSIATGSISTGASGTAFIGGRTAIPLTGLISAIDIPAILATTPAMTNGTVSIGGPVTTGSLLSASTQNFTALGGITAGTRISINSGGTAAFGGLAAAPTITVRSANIALSQNGGLGNASTNSLTLEAVSDGTVIIGGTADTTSTGYVLDASEALRLRARTITINASGASAGRVGVEIRGLTLNGSAAATGNTLQGTDAAFSIITPGTIRVNGNAIFNAMAATDAVRLTGDKVEINADTGSLILNGSSPGGILSITANNVHIASGSILERLGANVNFAGRDTALGQPLATSRPDGVIQASNLQFNVRDTLLIQNTGSLALNAGFFGRVGSVRITPTGTQGALLDMVIYGQLLDTGDIVRNGTSVRDLIFPRSTATAQTGVPGFSTNSSVNGCLLTAVSCGGGGVASQGPTAVSHAGPSAPERTEEEREREEAEAAAEEAARGATGPLRPIPPPVTIVNTRRLGVEPIITEPVTSGGNPNLQNDLPMPDAGEQP